MLPAKPITRPARSAAAISSALALPCNAVRPAVGLRKRILRQAILVQHCITEYCTFGSRGGEIADSVFARDCVFEGLARCRGRDIKHEQRSCGQSSRRPHRSRRTWHNRRNGGATAGSNGRFAPREWRRLVCSNRWLRHPHRLSGSGIAMEHGGGQCEDPECAIASPTPAHVRKECGALLGRQRPPPKRRKLFSCFETIHRTA